MHGLMRCAFGLALLACTACSGGEPEFIRLGATTSVHDSGLLAKLTEDFEASHPGYRLKALAGGSGQMIALAARGDIDVLISHSPAAELAFMQAGHGVLRRPLMENDFMIVGPPADPAGVRASRDVTAALSTIGKAGARFLSRGDDSGTHVRELELWAAAGIEPGGPGYQELGQGMGATLSAASETRAYTLVDRATFAMLRGGLELEVLAEGGDGVRNVYSVILTRDPRETEGSHQLLDWLTSEAGMAAIANFGMDRKGELLFVPYSPARGERD